MNDFFKIDNIHLDFYQKKIYAQTVHWINKNLLKHSLIDSLTSSVQNKINSYIPQKVHDGITATMREAIKGLLFGTKFIAPKPRIFPHIQYAENEILDKIKNHKLTAAAEGGLTGAGGFLWSLADFPLLLGIKIKLLQDIAAYYGYNGKEVKEKIFILLVLQSAFSSNTIKKETIRKIINFENDKDLLPDSVNDIDWQTLQQQYRDYIDIAKLLQMVPVIGAVVGTVTNYRLLNRLGKTAMFCYRIRYFQQLK